VTAFLVFVCALLGLVIGSFLNVVIYRVPRGESVVRPRSHCPGCGEQVRPRDEVPLVSWLLLKGKCRDCGARISARYFVVELLTGVLFAGIAARFGYSADLPAYLYLAAISVALALIDLDVRRLPNSLTLPSYLVGAVLLAIAALVGHDGGALLRAFAGMAALYVAFFALAFAYPGGMGFGDVKLAGVLGLYLGWLGWGSVVVGAFAGFILGGLVGISLILFGSAGRKSKVPFGPFMVTGALLAVFIGQTVASGYLSVTVH
jgi:leader peptidase (prepilin peptidase)/N-methyltransferase